MKKKILIQILWLIGFCYSPIIAQEKSLDILEYSQVDSKITIELEPMNHPEKDKKELKNQNKEDANLNIFVLGPKGKKITQPYSGKMSDAKNLKNIELNTKFWEPGLYTIFCQTNQRITPIKRIRIRPHKK